MTARRSGLRPLELFEEPATRATVEIEVGRRSAWIRKGRGVSRLLDELGTPHMFCPREKCLTLPIDRLSDLLALLEFRDRRVVIVTAVDR